MSAVAELERIREHLIRCLMLATGEPREVIMDRPHTAATRHAKEVKELRAAIAKAEGAA